mmetsp:Transcript_6504/g.15732  ORF Transcript_6504/g.15732 Transcript_6504/m.15732 type:complete len:117 (-) Transcript_6504:243-593(-)
MRLPTPRLLLLPVVVLSPFPSLCGRVALQPYMTDRGMYVSMRERVTCVRSMEGYPDRQTASRRLYAFCVWVHTRVGEWNGWAYPGWLCRCVCVRAMNEWVDEGHYLLLCVSENSVE